MATFAKVRLEGSWLTFLALNGNGFILAAGSANEAANEFGIDGNADNPQPLPGSGAVDVLLRRAGAGWSAQGGTAPIAHYLKGPLPDAQDSFGVAVGLSRDGNTLVVGANGEDGSSTNVGNSNDTNNLAVDSGAAYLFCRWHRVVNAPPPATLPLRQRSTRSSAATS